MVSWKAIVLALVLSVEALPNKALPKDVKCATEFTTKSVKYPKTQTRTKTQTETHTKVVIIKKNVTKIPKPKTIVVGKTIAVRTTVTADVKTDTATSTRTKISTSTAGTITVTRTETTTDTVTSTSYSTSTIATPDNGWIPFDQNPRTLTRRDVDKRKAKPTSPVKLGKGKCGKPLYVKVVKCVRTVVRKKNKTVTKRLPGKTTTLPRATKYSTTTKTKTATSTVFPANVKTTVTVDTTLTIMTIVDEYTTTTVKEISTIVEEVPVQFHAVCDSHNIANSVDGREIHELAGAGNDIVDLQGPTPYDCCLACHQTPNCLGSYHYKGGTCFGLIGSTCRPGQASSSSFTLGQTGGPGWTSLSNGPCGYFVRAAE